MSASLHILIIEDIPEDREFIRQALRQSADRPLTIHEATTGEQGCQILRPALASPRPIRQPDIVLLKVDLPDMDGMAVLQALKGEDESLPCPVILLANSPQQQLAQTAVAAGAQDFILKAQITPATLMQAVLNSIERFRLLQQVQASAAHFRWLTATVPVMIWVSGPDLGRIFFNQGWLDFTGRLLEEELGTGWTTGIHPDDYTRYLDVYTRCFAARQPFEIDYQLHNKDGEYCWVHDRGAPHFAPNGEFLGYTGSCIDITDRKEIEEQLAYQAELMDSAYDAIIAMDTEFNLTAWNRGAEAMYGWKASEVLGRNAPTVLAYQLSAEQRANGLREVAATGRYRAEVITAHRDGTLIYVEAITVAMHDAAGLLTGYTTISRDISERKHRERHQQFLGDLSAQLNRLADPAVLIATVVNALGGYLDLAFCAFSKVDVAANEVTITAGWRLNAPSITGTFALSDLLQAELVAEAQTGQVILIEDTTSDPRTATASVTGRVPLGVRAAIMAPYRRDEQWVALLIVASAAPRQWRADEVTLVVAVTERFWPVIEKARAEQALQVYAQRFRHMVDAIPQIVWIDNKQGETEYVNERWLAYTGFTIEASLGRGMRPAIHPDDLEAAVTLFSTALQKDEPFELELRLRQSDGAYRWHLCRSIPVYEEGQLIQWFGTATDIDERKRTELDQAFLITLGTEVRSLIGPEAIIGQIISALGAHLQAWRCTFHELTPNGEQIIIHPEWRQDGASSLTGRLPLASYSTPQFRDLFRAGQNLIVADTDTDPRTVAIAPGYRSLGVRAFIAIPYLREQRWAAVLALSSREPRAWQATEVALLETVVTRFWPAIERARAEQTLYKNNILLQGVINGTNDGIYVRDLTGRYLLVNSAGAAIVGLTPEQMLERNYREIFPPEVVAAIEAEDSPVLATGESYRNETTSIVQGVTHIFDSVRTAYRDFEGNILGVLNVSRDITPLKEVETRLRASQHELQELNATLEARVRERTAELIRRNQELDEFAYIASHDLKSPLRAVDNLASWITEDAGDLLPASSKEHLAKLRGRIKRMEALLDDLLAYSRVGRDDYPDTTVDTGALVTNIIHLLAHPEPFQITMQAAMPKIVTAQAPLELVLRNLIGNAIKHHHRSDGHVHVTARLLGKFVEFGVADDGPGIAPQFHTRIFQMFQTLKPRTQQEGSGIGLAVVKKMVESRHGTIRVESAEGAGATFYFTWPHSNG